MRKTPRTTSLPLRPAAEWVKAAPKGAIALIVAECFADRHVAARRVALGWLSGSRSDFSRIRAAAERYPDTAGMIEAAEDRTESDGAVYLCSDARCKTRWTVRPIPIGLLMCWVGYEDAICAPSTPITETLEPAPRPAARKDSFANVLPAKKETATTILPARTEVTARKVPPMTSVPDKTPLPVFAPLTALILNRKEAFRGNCAAPDGKFITDGHLLFKRSACNVDFQSNVKQVKVAAYGPECPLPDTQAQKLFDSTIRGAKHEAAICGYILGASAGATKDADMPLACLQGRAGQITIVNGHKLLFTQSVTGANCIKHEPGCGKIVMYKDDEPVAVLMAFKDSHAEALFQRMLATEPARTSIARIAPAAARRAG